VLQLLAPDRGRDGVGLPALLMGRAGDLLAGLESELLIGRAGDRPPDRTIPSPPAAEGVPGAVEELAAVDVAPAPVVFDCSTLRLLSGSV